MEHADGSSALTSLTTATGGGGVNNSNHIENSKPATRQLALMPGIYQLYALDPADGSIVWQFGDPESSSFVAAGPGVDRRAHLCQRLFFRARARPSGGWRWDLGGMECWGRDRLVWLVEEGRGGLGEQCLSFPLPLIPPLSLFPPPPPPPPDGHPHLELHAQHAQPYGLCGT